MFVVVYRWKLKPGTEPSFREAWCEMTESIAARSRTSGSRLHRADDGTLVAYAVWPSRTAWEDAGKLPSANANAGERMRACVEQSFEPLRLEVLDDLLRALPMGSPAF